MRRTRKVVVVQRRMTHYRVPFFGALRNELKAADYELVLAYGDATEQEATKNDTANIEWAHRLPTRYFMDGRICWQPFAHLTHGADAVVLTPENKLVNNLPSQFMQRRQRVMLWGHGANLQGDPRSWRERVKRWTGRRADWWLAYTAMSLPLILRTGFPEERITVLNNAVDTDEMREQRARVNPNTIASARAHYGFSGEHIGVFVGSLYADKRIDFLLQAADRVRERVPDFELLVLGSGPLSREVERFCDMRPWARWGGVCKGFDKVNAIAMSRLMLNPGLVGLGILDAFVCGVPMVTTDCGIHSPEIAYLQSGENGVMTANDLNVYVDAVVRLLQDAPFLEHLGAGCTASAQRYSVGNMALNFVQGVDACLRQPMWR